MFRCIDHSDIEEQGHWGSKISSYKHARVSVACCWKPEMKESYVDDVLRGAVDMQSDLQWGLLLWRNMQIGWKDEMDTEKRDKMKTGHQVLCMRLKERRPRVKVDLALTWQWDFLWYYSSCWPKHITFTTSKQFFLPQCVLEPMVSPLGGSRW